MLIHTKGSPLKIFSGLFLFYDKTELLLKLTSILLISIA